MPTITEKVYGQIELFRSSRNVEALSQAQDMIDMMSVDATSGVVNQEDPRSTKATLWVAFFNALDTEIDTKFNPNDRPQLSVAPPPEAGPAGIDPASIKDPALREQYQESIELNNRKNENYKYQMSLKKLNTSASENVRNFISREYIKQESDKISLVKMLDQGMKNAQRKEDLKGYISIVHAGSH